MGIEDWDLRKVSVGGYQREFLRYTFRIFEWGINHLLESQAKGMNVSQGLFIMDANRYTFAKHACFTCELDINLENHLTGCVKDAQLIR